VILVEEVIYRELSEDFVEHIHEPPMFRNNNPSIDDIQETMNLKRTILTGEQFQGEDGKKVILAMTPDVQNLIGLPFKSFKQMSDRLNNQYEEIRQLRQMLNDSHSYVYSIENLTLINLVKFWWSKRK